MLRFHIVPKRSAVILLVRFETNVISNHSKWPHFVLEQYGAVTCEHSLSAYLMIVINVLSSDGIYYEMKK